jgi:cardiolipin synthase
MRLIRAASAASRCGCWSTGSAPATAPPADLGEEFAKAGVHYRMFNPWFKRGSARSHRKIAVIDRALAFVGGINTNDDLLHDYAPIRRCRRRAGISR